MIAFRQARSRRSLILLLGTFLFAVLLWTSSEYRDAVGWGRARKDLVELEGSSRNVMKVSMLYGKRNTLYQRALLSQQRHAQRWGYGMSVLQEDISVGYWNKPSYLLSLVITELTKPVLGRMEWLMWVDADSVIINPAIPLEVFLPPHDLDDIHMVATKDHNGLNTGIFFLRVHQWTINMLVEALGYPVYNPKADLGASQDQAAMARVLNQTTGGPKGSGYKDGLVYLPRTWINTYEWNHAYEGSRGNFLVHFPGLGDQRWPHMSKWLDTIETAPDEWEVPLEETWYLGESAAFWDRVRAAKKAISSFEKSAHSSPHSTHPSSKEKEHLELAVKALRTVLQDEADNHELLQQRINDWNMVGGVP